MKYLSKMDAVDSSGCIMTIEKLKNLRGMISNVKALDEEIRALYSPISSPNGRVDSGGTRSNVPGDPTARSAMRIIEIRADLEVQREQMYALLQEVEKWLFTLDDSELVSIIRWHYILGYSWNKTNIKVFGRNDYDVSRKRVHRYFEKN